MTYVASVRQFHMVSSTIIISWFQFDKSTNARRAHEEKLAHSSITCAHSDRNTSHMGFPPRNLTKEHSFQELPIAAHLAGPGRERKDWLIPKEDLWAQDCWSQALLHDMEHCSQQFAAHSIYHPCLTSSCRVTRAGCSLGKPCFHAVSHG